MVTVRVDYEQLLRFVDKPGRYPGNLPLLANERGPDHPLVIASGPYHLTASWSAEVVMEAMNHELPDGLTIVEAEAHTLDTPTIDRTLRAFSYSVSLEQLPPGRLSDDIVRDRFADFAAAARFPMIKQIKGRSRAIDARTSVTIRRSRARTLHVQTAVTTGGALKPHHVVATIVSLTDLETQLLGVTKIGTTLDAPPDDERVSVATCAPAGVAS